MIERFYLKDNLLFQEVELYFKQGLILFTGPSGAGKSVLINSILATLGQKEANAKLSEVIFNNSINLEDFGIESDEITIFRQIKKGKLRYFINNQTVSKKVVAKIGELFINHLNPRDIEEFSSDTLLTTLDMITLSQDKSYGEILDSYQQLFREYEESLREIRQLNSKIEDMEEREEFIKFEINQIDKISPKIGEDEELQLTKKRLSKKDRIENYINEVEVIFEKRIPLLEIFDLMGYEKDSENIDNFFEEIKSKIEDIEDELSELDEVDVEKLLDRIETISELKNRYGTIEEAIKYRDSKIEELKHLQDLRREREEAISKKDDIEIRLEDVALHIREKRKESLAKFEELLNGYLKELKIGDSKLILEEGEFSKDGADVGRLNISDRDVQKLSYGEQNRVRLAILTLKTKFNSNENGILFLDEVDANLSGDEAFRIAKVLKELSKAYQVFAISHQPQLTASADQHFVVHKNGNESFVQELESEDSRADEIIRMIGGDLNDRGVRDFALNLIRDWL